MPVTLLDGILLFVMLVSAVLAMIRGFTPRFSRLARGWRRRRSPILRDDVLPYTQRYIETRTFPRRHHRRLFFITLLVVSLITMRISDFVLDPKPARSIARWLHFGAARGDPGCNRRFVS